MNIRSEESSAEIVKAIIAMAKSMNLKVVAEGVEYIEQLDYLKGLGCDEIQGYYFSKPLLFNDLVSYISGSTG
jgi:EAL domain-containing protein (putative c-di-GMP-specific phosphodiesterase class I)